MAVPNIADDDCRLLGLALLLAPGSGGRGGQRTRASRLGERIPLLDGVRNEGGVG